MKKLLLSLSITGALLLTACSNQEEKPKESTKDKTEQADKKKDTEKEAKKDDKQEAKASDKESTQATQEPSQQAPEDSTEEQSNKGKMGPGPDDPNYKPDPKFTDPVEGYDPVEGDKMPTAGDYSFKQQVENPARYQVINEGIDMDNPTDAEIERMRELSKDSPHGLQSEPSQGGY